MQLQFDALSSSFEFHYRKQLLNETFRKSLGKNCLNILLLQYTQNSLALLFFFFAWKLCQTVVIVYTPIQKIIMINMVNATQACSVTPS